MTKLIKIKPNAMRKLKKDYAPLTRANIKAMVALANSMEVLTPTRIVASSRHAEARLVEMLSASGNQFPNTLALKLVGDIS